MSEIDAGRRIPAPAALRRLLVLGLLAANVLLFALGSLAAAIGEGLSDWGKGAGGLGGWPDLLMTVFGLVVGGAAGFATFREGRPIPVAVVVFATGLLIGTGYLLGGHLVDPCGRGWWDLSDKVGDARLCSFDGEIDQRFHLLLHATTGLVSAAVATAIYRWRHLFADRPSVGV